MPDIVAFPVPKARISLVSDKELDAGTLALATLKLSQTQTPQQGLGLGIANSQRAMIKFPIYRSRGAILEIKTARRGLSNEYPTADIVCRVDGQTTAGIAPCIRSLDCVASALTEKTPRDEEGRCRS